MAASLLQSTMSLFLHPKTSPYALMWWTTATDFEKQTSPNIIGTLGRLSGKLLLNYMMLVRDLQERVKTFTTRHSKATEVRITGELSVVLTQLLTWLKSLTTTFRQMVTTLTALQHLFLELVGLLNYCENTNL